MGAMSPWHWAIVLIVLVVLFGSAKLPGAARGLGRSLRIFKSEIQEMQKDGKDGKDSTDDAEAERRELPTARKPVSDPADGEPVDKKSA
ncbi:Sec-independent protein translocase subunit TatA [Gordonia shandongensis]|uniref:Sec-independent protein translocase subunit TatA n=1 Tax=Gordonia shandongensis TaxID=376351 RepID=UPI0003F4BBF3|nr:Sec-independent protein translocase subunit TatA [Gordonia shandongensis]